MRMVVAALLDGRVRLDALYPLLDISLEPFCGSDAPRHLHLAGIAGAHLYIARARGQFHMHRPGHLQGTLERSFRGACGRQGMEANQSRDRTT